MQSYKYSKNGQFKSSKIYGNVSAFLSVAAIVTGFIGIIVGLLFIVIFYVAAYECGFSDAPECY
jgi:uncharacterized membrane protein